MKRILLAALFIGAGLSSVDSAQAQRATPVAKQPEAAPLKVQRMDFDNDQVEGRMVRPEDVLVDTTRRAYHGTLIRLRGTFHDAMLKSAEGR